MENEKTALESKLALAHQELEAAAAQNQQLLDQFQVVTQSLEEKQRNAVCEADRKASRLAVGLQPNFTSVL